MLPRMKSGISRLSRFDSNVELKEKLIPQYDNKRDPKSAEFGQEEEEKKPYEKIEIDIQDDVKQRTKS